MVVSDLAFSPNVSPKLYDPKRYSHFGAYAEDLSCILDQLQVEKTAYLGHSMSAMIGCIAATKRPDLFQHLILLGGSPRYLNALGYSGGFTREELNNIFKSIWQNFSRWVHDFGPKAIGVNNSAATAEFEGSLERMKPGIALGVARTVFLHDNTQVLQDVHVRSTIIQSAKDIIVPKSVAYYLK